VAAVTEPQPEPQPEPAPRPSEYEGPYEAEIYGRDATGEPVNSYGRTETMNREGKP